MQCVTAAGKSYRGRETRPSLQVPSGPISRAVDSSMPAVDAVVSTRSASARGRNRTCKGLPPRDFKSLAFTNFATRAAYGMSNDECRMSNDQLDAVGMRACGRLHLTDRRRRAVRPLVRTLDRGNGLLVGLGHEHDRR